ncbi:fibronectin type III domain-containing protein [Aminicella lysinilytica]|uniref:fibronectin type III domain-containing protein n=1 Tax=Aminicella lysinilytica TaxID=433323 RepID=UPI0026EA1440|nr:right-handed parallel beta-helix repeat-containing protein [Aminicella lysinilytica]
MSVRSNFLKIAFFSMVMIMTVFLCAFGSNEVSAASIARPAGVSCYNKTYNSVSIKWNKVKKAKSYVVYKYDSYTNHFKRISIVKGNTNVKYTVKGLTKGTEYKFMIKSAKTIKGTGVSKSSEVVTETTYKPESYAITPDSLPCNSNMLNYSHYNSQTRLYYTIRSYMELFEKCGGGTLELSAGTYYITNTIFIPSNVTIILDDGVEMIKEENTGCDMAPSHSMFHLIRPSKGKKANSVRGYNGERNIKLIGNGSATIDMKSYDNSNCIETGHNYRLSIAGISFKNIMHGHFIEMDACKSVTVKNCNFSGITGDDIREAINLDTPDEATGGYTAVWSKFDKTANYKVNISNCTFSDMGRSVGTHNYSYGHPHRYISITNCTMTGMRSYGIDMMYWQDSTITGNKITGSDDAMIKGAGILGKGITRCTIKDNIIDKFYYGMLFKSEQSSGYAEITNDLSDSNISDLSHNYTGVIGVDLKGKNYSGLYCSDDSSSWIRLRFNR